MNSEGILIVSWMEGRSKVKPEIVFWSCCSLITFSSSWQQPLDFFVCIPHLPQTGFAAANNWVDASRFMQ